VNPVQFETQIKYICQTHRVISLDELAECIIKNRYLPDKSIIITFDDGYKDNYLKAFPILKKYGAPATIFLTTDYIDSGKLLWWDMIGYVVYNTRANCLEVDGFHYSLMSPNERQITKDLLMWRATKLSEAERTHLIDKLISMSGVKIPPYIGKELMLSWQDVKEMRGSNISFGAHTVTHPIMSKISSQQARNQIAQSKKTIEEKLNLPVTEFAYPNGQSGDFNTDTIRLLKESGLRCAVTTIPKLISPKTDQYELGRIGPGKNLHELRLLIFGPYADLYSLYDITKSIAHRFNYLRNPT
jgi:peptidoglycan/xylan/chitin deacetylase (PgdA/CDA1 family)